MEKMIEKGAKIITDIFVWNESKKKNSALIIVSNIRCINIQLSEIHCCF